MANTLKETPTGLVHVQLGAELHAAARANALEADRSLASVIRLALQQYLDEQS
jgi:hypothetical protein